jgi:vitamin B12 transporter
LEASWELRADPWSVRAEGSLQDPHNLSAGASDTELLRRSRHSFTLSASRRIGRGDLGVEVLQSGAREDVEAASGVRARDGGYVLGALFGKLRLAPSWSVAARLDNALGRRYELANGYATPGRAASISIRYTFR